MHTKKINCNSLFSYYFGKKQGRPCIEYLLHLVQNVYLILKKTLFSIE